MGDVSAFDALKEGVKSAVDSCRSEPRTFVTLFDKIDWIFRILLSLFVFSISRRN